jgi:DNA-binding LytR/AlgR family response regulator
MRVLVVDDEPAARRRLALMLEELDEEIVGEAANGIEALEMARDRRPDLLLLDIEMPEVDGFDVARHLPIPRPLLVFQTAYDEHALRAFDHAALDYLVKPVTLDGLRRALGRARERLETPAAEPDAATLHEVRTSVRGEAPRRRRLLVREGKGHRLVAFEQIARFTADEGVVFAHLDGGDRRLTDYTLAELEERAGDAFVRASRGELVNAEAVERIVRNGDGSATLGLRGGVTVHVSRRRAAEVWERLAD